MVAAGNLLVDFLYPLAVLQMLGAGAGSDAFFFFAALNLFVLLVFVQPIAGVMTARLAAARSDAEWRLLAWSGHFGAALIYGGVALLLLLTADAWLGAMMPRTGEHGLYREMLWWQAAALVFAGVHTSAVAALQSRRRFLLAEAIALLCAVAFYLPFREVLESRGVVAGTALLAGRGAVQLGLMLLLSGRPVWRGVPAVVGEIFAQFRLPVLGAVYSKTDLLLDRYLLGRGGDGLLSVFHMAQQLLGIVTALYSKTFVPPLRVAAAKDVAEGNLASLVARARRHARLAVAAGGSCLLAALVVVLLPQPLGRQLDMSPELVAEVAGLVMALTGTTLGGIIGLAVGPMFYALGRQDTLVKASMALYTLVFPIKILAFHLFGIRGLALMASLYFLAAAGMLLVLLRRELRAHA